MGRTARGPRSSAKVTATSARSCFAARRRRTSTSRSTGGRAKKPTRRSARRIASVMRRSTADSSGLRRRKSASGPSKRDQRGDAEKRCRDSDDARFGTERAAGENVGAELANREQAGCFLVTADGESEDQAFEEIPRDVKTD